GCEEEHRQEGREEVAGQEGCEEGHQEAGRQEGRGQEACCQEGCQEACRAQGHQEVRPGDAGGTCRTGPLRPAGALTSAPCTLSPFCPGGEGGFSGVAGCGSKVSTIGRR